MRIAAVVAIGLVLVSSSAAAPAARPPGQIERALRAAARTASVPATLEVTYFEQSGPRGQERFRLHADGRLTRTTPGPNGRDRSRTVRVGRAEVVAVVRLLVRLRAWRQPPTSQPLPMVVYVDDLWIRIGRASTHVSDWHYSGGSSALGPVQTRLWRLFDAHR